VAVLGILVWLWRQQAPSKVSKTPQAPAPVAQSLPSEEKKEKAPETRSSRSLTQLFPKQAWLDDYLKIPVSFGDEKEGLLVSLGIAPAGKDPDSIRDPDELRPAVLLLKKEKDSFVQKDLFDFDTPLPTQAGIRGSDLKGIPRITLKSLMDLDRDGKMEIVAGVDTRGDFAQAIGFLKWQGDQLQWIKTRGKSGQEKIALWLTGSTSQETEDVSTGKAKGEGPIEVIHKKGVLDPKAPQKGFAWTSTSWEMRNGVLVEK